MLSSGNSGSYGNFIPSLLGVSIVVSSICISANSVGGIPFLYIFSSIHCRFLDDDHSGWCDDTLGWYNDTSL